MLVKFLSWCCGVDIPKLLADNIEMRIEIERLKSLQDGRKVDRIQLVKDVSQYLMKIR